MRILSSTSHEIKIEIFWKLISVHIVQVDNCLRVNASSEFLITNSHADNWPKGMVYSFIKYFCHTQTPIFVCFLKRKFWTHPLEIKWTHKDFFWKSPFVIIWRKKVITIWDGMRVSKWRESFHFGKEYPFKKSSDNKTIVSRISCCHVLFG